MFASLNNIFLKLLCLVFICVLATPMAVNFLTPDANISPSEKRYLQALPKWKERESLKSFFSDLTKYANDQFGFRENIITKYNQVLWLLGESPSAYVVRGKDNWLFLKIRDPLLSETEYSNQTIINIMDRRVGHARKLHDELKKRGIIYRHIVASNKMAVYPEHLPAIYKLTSVDASLREFKKLVEPEIANSFLYTDEIVKRYKKIHPNQPLYFKNDTHWNDLGAYQAYLALIDSIKQQAPTLPLKRIEREFELRNKLSGDLANYVGLANQLSAEEPFTWNQECAKRDNVTQIRWDVSQSRCDVNSTKILIIGDSFMAGLNTYLSQSAGRLMMMGQNTSRYRLLKLIDEYQPDIVIEEIVERNLARPIPH